MGRMVSEIGATAVVLLAALLVRCGKDGTGAALGPTAGSECSANYNGIWIGPNSAKLTLTANCEVTFQGAPYCLSTGSYSALLGSSGAMTIEIASHTGSVTSCPGVSRFQCAYILSDTLTLDCGGGTVAYSKVTE